MADTYSFVPEGYGLWHTSVNSNDAIGIEIVMCYDTLQPTNMPTILPTTPTTMPTSWPTAPSFEPSREPSMHPTKVPSIELSSSSSEVDTTDGLSPQETDSMGMLL